MLLLNIESRKTYWNVKQTGTLSKDVFDQHALKYKLLNTSFLNLIKLHDVPYVTFRDNRINSLAFFEKQLLLPLTTNSARGQKRVKNAHLEIKYLFL